MENCLSVVTIYGPKGFMMIPENSVLLATIKMNNTAYYGGVKFERNTGDNYEGIVNLGSLFSIAHGQAHVLYEAIVVSPQGDFLSFFHSESAGSFALRFISESVAHSKLLVASRAVAV